MKTFLKFAAIAAIIAFAVISCSPPEVPEVHYEWWDQFNEQYDPSKITNAGYSGAFTFVVKSISTTGATSSNLSISTTTANAQNTVNITITDTNADIYKSDNPEAKLKEFLSFYTYDPNEITPPEINSGKTHTLIPYTGWELDKKSGNNSFDLNLTSPFTAASSKLVYKIDGSKYTYRDGLKPDKDGNGIPGEAYYDDWYGVLGVDGITNTRSPILPENKSITVSLSSTFPNLTAVGATIGTTDLPADFNFPTESDTTTKAGAIISIYSASSFPTALSFLTADDKDDILISLISGIKLEKFTEADGKWTPSAFFASFDEKDHRIIIKDFKPEHMTAYRVVFERGGIKLETGKEFFNVKQRFNVSLGGSTVSGGRNSRTRGEGNGKLYNNPLIRNFIDLQGSSYTDNTGTYATYYTYTYSWSPGYIKKQILLTTEPNSSYSPVSDPDSTSYDKDDTNYDPTKDSSDSSYVPGSNDRYLTPRYVPYNDPANTTANGGTGITYYTPSDIPANSPLNTTIGARTTIAPSATSPLTTLAPPPADPNLGAYNDWVWASDASVLWDTYTQTPTPIRYTSTTEYGNEIRNRADLQLDSIDRNGNNVILRLEIGPNSVTKDGVTTRYYAKQLDPAAFKDNFKIIYSKNSTYNPTSSGSTVSDIVEIGIKNVEFKQEKTGSDKFDDTSTVKYSGFNVIYITLDPAYMQNTRTKYILVGNGLGYNDGISVFSSDNIWENKGVKVYPANNF